MDNISGTEGVTRVVRHLENIMGVYRKVDFLLITKTIHVHEPTEIYITFFKGFSANLRTRLDFSTIYHPRTYG